MSALAVGSDWKKIVEGVVEYRATDGYACEVRSRLGDLTRRAFLTAHLLTANAEQAENAVLEALDAWDPDEESEEALLDRVLEGAVKLPAGRQTARFDPTATAAALLPAPLQAVLHLPPQLRRCFVLRILAGQSRQDCARLLHLQSGQVDECTSTALRCLPSLSGRLAAGVEYLVWKRRIG